MDLFTIGFIMGVVWFFGVATLYILAKRGPQKVRDWFVEPPEDEG